MKTNRGGLLAGEAVISERKLHTNEIVRGGIEIKCEKGMRRKKERERGNSGNSTVVYRVIFWTGREIEMI